ncbi:iron-sulfur cluster biosynthesis family protein [Dellaglioa sp. P0083]|uniref:iron-sulfur cluster biosynthesis family protein n=1 Tax=Dellaglioa kimchii TaxID=3344667 RepID=UPI0038D4ADCE
MYLKISEDAKSKIMKLMGNDSEILLDFDDGVGALSNEGTCTLDSSFRMLVIDDQNDSKAYDGTIDSDLGPIRVKEYSKTYMDENMQLVVNERFNSLALHGDNSGLLTGNVTLESLVKN